MQSFKFFNLRKTFSEVFLILSLFFITQFNSFSFSYGDWTRIDSPGFITNQGADAIRIQTAMGDYLQFAPLVIALGFVTYYQDSNLFGIIKGEKKLNDLISDKKQSYKDDGLAQLGLTTIASLGTMYALKYSVGRPRPNQYERHENSGVSFPSGHTTIAFAPSFFVAFRYGWLKALPSLAISTFVGYSRVSGRAHYITDVVAAAGISFIYAFLFTFKYEYKGVHIALTPPMRAQYGIGLQISW